MYESFQLDYAKYYAGGRETAEWLRGQFGRHTHLNGKAILDWGCGPGRVVRHLPQIMGRDCVIYGTDYNPRSIGWCREHLPGITFTLNPLTADLPYPDATFDLIYGISILTHLSESLHREWVAELGRVLRPGGLLLLTTQGRSYRVKLTDRERDAFDRGELVVRGRVTEGHRVFSAFQPPEYMRKLWGDLTVVDHQEPTPERGRALPQDVWVVRKGG
jgi:SAM-dependent methyltransferase